MLNERDIRYAVDLQRRSYRLLNWMAKAVEDGFIEFETAHEYSSFPEATKEWILSHYQNIPPSARVAREDLDDFCAFFSTYLENSFDLDSDPGMHLYSPNAHCFCPWCSWLVKAPALKTKKVTSADKRRARKMKTKVIRSIAAEHGVDITPKTVDGIVDDAYFREIVSLVTYGYDLLKRLKGIANGPAVLALWRGFAWHETGSPKHGFELKAAAIIQAEEQLRVIVLSTAGYRN